MRVSQAQYARLRGVSRNAVSLAVKEGRIKLERDKKIDVEKADRQWESNTVKRAGSGSDATVTAEGVPSYAASRSVREAYAALREKAEYNKLIGELCPKADVVNSIRSVISVARTNLLAVPASLAPLLAAELDGGRCAEMLSRAVREVLEELSNARNYRISDFKLDSTAQIDG